MSRRDLKSPERLQDAALLVARLGALRGNTVLRPMTRDGWGSANLEGPLLRVTVFYRPVPPRPVAVRAL